MSRPPCRHCGKNSQSRPKGLCWPCSLDPKIRGRYPSGSRVGVGLNGIGGRARPTGALPGSPEKLAVLAERAAKGLPLNSPLDVQFPVYQRPSAESGGGSSGRRRRRHAREDRPRRTLRWAGPLESLAE